MEGRSKLICNTTLFFIIINQSHSQMCQITATEFLLSISASSKQCQSHGLHLGNYLHIINTPFKNEISYFFGLNKQLRPALWQHNHCQAQWYKLNFMHWPHTNTGRAFTAFKIILLDVKSCSADRYQDFVGTYCCRLTCSCKKMVPTYQNRQYHIRKDDKLHSLPWMPQIWYVLSSPFSFRSFFETEVPLNHVVQ